MFFESYENRMMVQVAFICVLYPTLMLGYMGQAAYLSKNLNDVENGFFRSIPSRSISTGDFVF